MSGGGTLGTRDPHRVNHRPLAIVDGRGHARAEVGGARLRSAAESDRTAAPPRS